MELRDDEVDAQKRSLYPSLSISNPPTAPNIYNNIDEQVVARIPEEPLASEQHGNTFRLQKINEIQRLLEAEREKRRTLAKKYQRAINTISGLSYSLEGWGT